MIEPEAPVLLAPPVIGLLGDPELAGNVPRRLAPRQLDFGLPQLPDDLLRCVPLPTHRLPLSNLDPNNLAGSI